MDGFHPITRRWFTSRFPAPTEPQRDGWPAIMAGDATLIAAPTGSGKTLTAFLVCIDRLLREAVAGTLVDATRVLYVSPLKALSNDVRRNLEAPLAEIRSEALADGHVLPEIRALVRTGDTPASQRQAMLKRPPHILVTTPESLFLLLTSEKSREILRTVDTVIVDEIHALAKDKRGSHLSLSLARLDALRATTGAPPPVRIGLSATQKPIELVAAYLTGGGPCRIIDSGHRRALDLGVEVPRTELSAVCSSEQWQEVYERLQELIATHRSTLIFVNTRKLAERVSFHLAQQLGDDAVASHHGSLARERRLAVEERLKNGELKAIVATASLELGIDVGAIDLVCQIGSPRSIATFLQRVGRAGHAVRATPKGRLFALTRDELLESLALVKAVRAGVLDRIEVPEKPLDILAQQITAAAVEGEWDETALYDVMRAAYPYRDLARAEFDEVVTMLAGGFADGRQRDAYLHRDGIHGKVRARRGARLRVITSGGAIPEQGDYRVLEEGSGAVVGTINEDFAIESNVGDIFLLGSTSWQVLGVRGSDVLVRDRKGAPPTIPFWLGEAPGRTVELSEAVSDLREALGERIDLGQLEQDPVYRLESLGELIDRDPEPYRAARAWLDEAVPGNAWASLQAVHYVAAQKAALGLVPTQRRVVFERFFDETGGMQLVIHSPYGMRINKGWGLALRKRFCRTFDFELQASADNDGIVLSLGPHQSFPVDQLFKMLSPENVKPLLEQALLQVPLFNIRWRWNATRSLAVLRSSAKGRVPPALQRFRADDLLTAVFPAQTQCQEHVTGDIELPDHPLVRQTVHDCLHEAIDLPRLSAVLERVRAGDVELIARDTREPSPFSYQLLNAYPYAFLDDAPLEERRARAVAMRRTLKVSELRDLGRLDDAAIAQVRAQAWPLARTPDELHDVLLAAGALSAGECVESGWQESFDALVATGRAAVVAASGATLWIAAEALPLARAAYPDAAIEPRLRLPPDLAKIWTSEDARIAVVKGYTELRPVVTAASVARALGLDEGFVGAALAALEGRGELLRGAFTPGGAGGEWCCRRHLARIHRLTLDGLRRQVEPVPQAVFYSYLLRRHRLYRDDAARRLEGKHGLLESLAMLQGFDAGAGAWETELLPARVEDFSSVWLDELTHSGVVTWGRLSPPRRDEDDGPMQQGMTRTVPVALMLREHLAWLLPPGREPPAPAHVRAHAATVYDALVQHGAQFLSELKLRVATRLLESQIEDALGELCRLGLVHADGFAAIRPFVSRNKKQAQRARPGLAARFLTPPTYALGGRWALFPPPVPDVSPELRLENWVWLLLTRYGVIWRDLLVRETAAPAWGDLAPVLRRLEARGEVRGGRFVAGVFGEQFGLPDAVEGLRRERDRPGEGDWAVVAAADPLNLVGVLDDAPRIASSRQALLLIWNGRHVATRDGLDTSFHAAVPPALEAAMRQALQLGGAFRRSMFSRASTDVRS